MKEDDQYDYYELYEQYEHVEHYKHYEHYENLENYDHYEQYEHYEHYELYGKIVNIHIRDFFLLHFFQPPHPQPLSTFIKIYKIIYFFFYLMLFNLLYLLWIDLR